MSGHSKWATIKRAKAVTDAKKGKAFTKLAKNITVAVQTGGGGDPTFNFQLRQALEKAKEVGMPKDNIDRAIKRGTGEGKEAIKAVTYEGYGPAGSAFIVEAITDNSNRTLQAVRQIFERHGGKLGGEGTVAWMFESKGQILVEKQQGTEDLALELIDQGVEDVKETPEGLEIYTKPADLEKTKKFIESKGIKILSSENIMKPQQSVELSEADQTKVQTLIDALNEDDDVVAVHNNANL
ncbi:MAG TPA: YebC/PmpR family DNA-binding transcriptional regulator [Methylomirabilota bacterium]|nr:YebC/PmpR family DNA-binding transcriptional regulator [Methylomirabilota bacterium]